MFAFLAFASCALFAPNEERSFVAFMREHNLAYTGDEYNLRLGIYITNARRVAEFNREGNTYTVALNQFACFTPAEYRALLSARPSFRAGAKLQAKTTSAAPDAIDWRTKGVVNKVKDQSSCGSCWAFSAIGAQESQWAIVSGTLQSLSESNLVDCVDTCWGCSGGWPSSAYTYVIDHQSGKFMLDSDYPYKPVQGACAFDASKGIQNIKGFVDVTKGDEQDLKEKVGTLGPASICIDASSWGFQMYSGGIYDDTHCSSTVLDHAVIAVGYGNDGWHDFWIVRNSWGSGWGESGYVRMIRNKKNQCGEATVALVPVNQ